MQFPGWNSPRWNEMPFDASFSPRACLSRSEKDGARTWILLETEKVDFRQVHSLLGAFLPGQSTRTRHSLSSPYSQQRYMYHDILVI